MPIVILLLEIPVSGVSKVHGPAVKLHNVPSVQRRLVFGGRKEKNFHDTLMHWGGLQV